MNVESLLIGGMSKNILSQYFDVNSNLALILISVLGGLSLQYLFKSFEGVFILNSSFYLFNKLKKLFMNFLGSSFFKASISKDEKIV